MSARIISNAVYGGNIANLTQITKTSTSSAPAGTATLVAGATLRDGRSFRITNTGLYEGGVLHKRFEKQPRSVSCSPERIVVDGQVLVEADVKRIVPQQAARRVSPNIMRALGIDVGVPDTSNDEALARLLASEYESAPLASVHIGDNDDEIVVKEAVVAPKRKRAKPATTAPRKKKPAPLALDWAAVPLAEKHSERDECTVCLSNKRDVACQPCGHVLMCVACAVKCRDAARQKKDAFQCPECRAAIESAARVFI